MTPLFGSVIADVLIVTACGLLGGFGLGLLHENGIELPRRRSVIGEDDQPTAYLDFGFLADVFVGAMAAVIVYALNPSAEPMQLIGTSLVSGLGGAGILKGYVEARRNQALTRIADEALDIASVGGGSDLRLRGLSAEEAPDNAREERIDTLRRQVRDLAK